MPNNYLIQNNKVRKLKKYSIENINKKFYLIDSVSFILLKKIKELLLAFTHYCYQIIFHNSEYRKTFLLKHLNKD